ncbi:MAG: hypothetical protein NWF07_06020 [Candidatus Bathyarchaeota archaeon]|nr:hypothetical protein [Candidatus Bathyarchaeota archaeon]
MFGNLIGIIIINIILQAPALWYSARNILGINRVEFMDAVKITAVFTIVNLLMQIFIGAEVAEFFQIIAYLYVVRRYFETSWRNAGLIALFMLFINIVISLLLMGPGLFLYIR